MNSQKVLKCKTVVIGAGMAGIGASLNFLKNNHEDFLVFEALERIGGRVFTDSDGKNKAFLILRFGFYIDCFFLLVLLKRKGIFRNRSSSIRVDNSDFFLIILGFFKCILKLISSGSMAKTEIRYMK
jgi:predicted NAD/FAD-binding protein